MGTLNETPVTDTTLPSTFSNSNQVIVIVPGLPAGPSAAAASPAPRIALPSAARSSVPASAAKTATTVPTLLGNMLSGIPSGGLSIGDIVADARSKMGIWERVTTDFSHVLSHAASGQKVRERADVTDALVSLGVHPNKARLFTGDDVLNRCETFFIAADAGNTTFAKSDPKKEQLVALASLPQILECTQNGATLTPDMKVGAARFEEGMRKALGTRMQNPDVTLGDLFSGAVQNPGSVLRSLIDLIAKGAQALPALAPAGP